MSAAKTSSSRIHAGAEQLSLDLGLPWPLQRQHADNLFFCLLAGPDDAARTAALRKDLCSWHGLAGQLLVAHHFHVSLCSLGSHASLHPWLIETAMRVGEAVRATPFELTFARYASFRSRGKAPLVLLCDSGKVELMALQRAVGAALGHTKAARFEPHCTLLYGHCSVPTTRLENPVT